MAALPEAPGLLRGAEEEEEGLGVSLAVGLQKGELPEDLGEEAGLRKQVQKGHLAHGVGEAGGVGLHPGLEGGEEGLVHGEARRLLVPPVAQQKVLGAP